MKKKIGCLVIKIISHCVWDDPISRGHVLNVFRNDQQNLTECLLRAFADRCRNEVVTKDCNIIHVKVYPDQQNTCNL